MILFILGICTYNYFEISLNLDIIKEPRDRIYGIIYGGKLFRVVP